MQLRKISTLLTLCFLLIGFIAKSNTLKSPFKEIIIFSRAAKGRAHKTIDKKGNVEGAHLSGNPDYPLVYVSESKMNAEDLKKLKELVLKIEKLLDENAIPTFDGEFYRSVTITLKRGEQLEFKTALKENFAWEEVQQIWELIAKQEAGRW